MAESYFWLVTRDPETNRPYLLAGGRTEDEARTKGLEILGGVDFTIKKFPTRDLGRASSLLKGNRLEQTHSVHKAAERLGHERTVKRRMAKLRQRNPINT